MVQMVGYRWFAKQQADLLKINGYVRNTLRGDVEILAQAKDDDLQIFIDHLRIGPSRARVDKLVKEPVEENKIYKEFNIRM